MQARHRAFGTLLAVAALFAVGCTDSSGVAVKGRTGDTTATTDSTPTTDVPNLGTLTWGKCTDKLATETTLECATLKVPLDYAHPTGTTIDLALVRAPATASREGAVLFNPGGPGASGFDPIAVNGTYLQSQLGLTHFDLVGFDPRGVDRSGGLVCVDAAFEDAHLYLDDTPDTPAAQKLLDEANTGYQDGCVAKYGATLKFYSTANTARDMDQIRAALGDSQLSYLGISYGTYLGAVYASLFPGKVRAMVLDSAYEPNGDTVEQQYLTQLVGFEGAFDDWVAWCQSDAACAFKAADVGARWDALRLKMDNHPLASSDGRAINQSTMDVATEASLYSKSQWPVLAEALAKAETGDGSAMLALADDYNGRHSDGTYDTLFQSIGVIRCASGINTQPAADPASLLKELQTKAPHFTRGLRLKDLTGDVDGCGKLTGQASPVKVSYQGSGPIVIVGGTKDPATPIRWAQVMTKELGTKATMVTFTGEGHGQLLASTCITKIEGSLLADLTSPPANTVCNPDPVIQRPSWFDTIKFPASFSEVVPLAAVKAALGLTDTQGYAELRTTSQSAKDAASAFDATLIAAGFQNQGSHDLGITDSIETGYSAPNGDLLVVVLLGPTAFDTQDLATAKPSVPAGKTVVMYFYLPQ